MLPIYKMILTEETEGMDFIALVDSPAHMKAFEYFNGKSEKVKYHFNEEKRVVTGVAIAVDLPIYRRDEQFGEHYVVFDKKETMQIAQKMFKGGYLNNVNEMHDSNKQIKDIYLFESYFVDNARGVKAPDTFEGQNLKDGSWIVSYKVDNDKVWNDIKKGKHIGFSIEGWFDKKFIKTKQTQMKKQSKSLFEMVFGKAKFETATTVEGVEVAWTGALEVGTELRVVTEEGEVLAPEGMHSIEMEGTTMVITVDGNGIITAIEEMPAEDAPAEDAPEAVTPEAVAEVVAEMSKQLKAEIESLKAENSKFSKQIETLVNELDKENKRKFNTTPKTTKTWRNFTK
jgi:uncharacterized protein YdcH (DUF465 family)